MISLVLDDKYHAIKMFLYMSMSALSSQNNNFIYTAYRKCLEKYYMLKREVKDLKSKNHKLDDELKQIKYYGAYCVLDIEASIANKTDTDTEYESDPYESDPYEIV